MHVKLSNFKFISLVTILLLIMGDPKSEAQRPPYDKQKSSSPVQVNGLEFVANVQAQWYAPVPPVIELMITNRTNKPIVFQTFDTFGLKIKTEDGTIVGTHLGRNGTCLTKPILLLPGTHYSLIRTTTLSVDKDSQSTKFLYLDGTGTNFGSRRPLKKANYYLTFWFSRPPVNDSEIADARTRLNLENFSIWSGEGATADVSFELLDPLPGS